MPRRFGRPHPRESSGSCWALLRADLGVAVYMLCEVGAAMGVRGKRREHARADQSEMLACSRGEEGVSQIAECFVCNASEFFARFYLALPLILAYKYYAQRQFRLLSIRKRRRRHTLDWSYICDSSGITWTRYGFVLLVFLYYYAE